MTEAADTPAAEDAGLINTEDTGQDQGPAETLELDQKTLEAVAAKFGWKADGELDAAAFLERSPKVMDEQRRKLKALDRVAKNLQTQMHGQKKASVTARIAKAIEDGDADVADKIADELVETPGQAEYADFKERNADWYEIDPEATAFVLALDQQLSKTLGTKDPVKHFETIEARVKKRFPELFEDAAPAKEPKKEAKAAQPFVHGATRVSKAAPTQKTAATLTAEERKAAEAMGVSYDSYAQSANKLAEKAKAA